MVPVQNIPWPITPNTGGKIDIGDVIGRDGFIVGLVEEMTHGTDVLLVDPRRMGKTMILRRLCNEAGGRFDAVMIDLEGATSTSECFERMAKALSRNAAVWERTKQVIGRFVDSTSLELGIVSVKAVTSDRLPVDLLGDVMAAIDRQLADKGQQLIIALDEVPIAVELIFKKEGKEEAAKFLHLLRHLQSSTNSIRWVLAGSIGFHHVLHQVGVTEGVLADFATRSPGPLTEPDATFLGLCLLMGIGAEPDKDLAGRLAVTSGCIPFIMHHVAHRLGQDAAPPTGLDQVDRAFEAFARDRDASRALTHLLTRLEDNTTLTALLDLLALSGPSTVDAISAAMDTDRNELLKYLDRLRDDHYLTFDGALYSWRYPVLQRVWIIRRDLEP